MAKSFIHENKGLLAILLVTGVLFASVSALSAFDVGGSFIYNVNVATSDLQINSAFGNYAASSPNGASITQRDVGTITLRPPSKAATTWDANGASPVTYTILPIQFADAQGHLTPGNTPMVLNNVTLNNGPNGAPLVWTTYGFTTTITFATIVSSQQDHNYGAINVLVSLDINCQSMFLGNMSFQTAYGMGQVLSVEKYTTDPNLQKYLTGTDVGTGNGAPSVNPTQAAGSQLQPPNAAGGAAPQDYILTLGGGLTPGIFYTFGPLFFKTGISSYINVGIKYQIFFTILTSRPPFQNTVTPITELENIQSSQGSAGMGGLFGGIFGGNFLVMAAVAIVGFIFLWKILPAVLPAWINRKRKK
jgi:hypothetical protein